MTGKPALRDPDIERARTIARWMDRYGLDPLETIAVTTLRAIEPLVARYLDKQPRRRQV